MIWIIGFVVLLIVGSFARSAENEIVMRQAMAETDPTVRRLKMSHAEQLMQTTDYESRKVLINSVVIK